MLHQQMRELQLHGQEATSSIITTKPKSQVMSSREGFDAYFCILESSYTFIQRVMTSSSTMAK